MLTYNGLSKELPLFREYQALATKLADGLDWSHITRLVLDEDLFQLNRAGTRQDYLRVLKKRAQPFDQAFFQLVCQQFQLARWANFSGLIINQALFREVFYELVWTSVQEGKQQLTRREVDNYFQAKKITDPHLMSFSKKTWKVSQNRAVHYLVRMGYLTARKPWLIRNPFAPELILDWLKEHDYDSIAKLLALEK